MAAARAASGPSGLGDGTGDGAGALRRMGTNASRYWAGEMTLKDVLRGGPESALDVDGRDSEGREAEVMDATLRARLAQAKLTPDDDLQHAAMRGDLKKVKRAVEQRADPKLPNIRGVTPLMLGASSSGKEALEVLQELVNKRSDMQARDNNGWMVIHHACRNGKIDAARLLIQYLADPSVKTHDDKTTLMLSAMEGKTDLVKELLKNKQVHRQVLDKDALGATALHYSAKEGTVDMLKCLVENSAKVGSKDIDARTPLMWAAEYGKLDSVKVLCKRGADINGKDRTSRSALSYACMNSYEGVALWLVKKGADPYQPDVAGESPMSLADDLGLSEVKRAVKLLRMAQEEEQDQ